MRESCRVQASAGRPATDLFIFLSRPHPLHLTPLKTDGDAGRPDSQDKSGRVVTGMTGGGLKLLSDRSMLRHLPVKIFYSNKTKRRQIL